MVNDCGLVILLLRALARGGAEAAVIASACLVWCRVLFFGEPLLHWNDDLSMRRASSLHLPVLCVWCRVFCFRPAGEGHRLHTLDGNLSMR